MSWTQLSHLRGSGLTPGWSTKTLSATWLRRKGRKKRKKYIFTERNGIHVIDLHKSLKKIEVAYAEIGRAHV